VSVLLFLILAVLIGSAITMVGEGLQWPSWVQVLVALGAGLLLWQVMG
jgi:hypothetical protein